MAEGLPIGTILLDRYRIEREVGDGGMSHVYLASDQWRKESLAVIKTPFAQLLQDKWIVKKFKQEAESLARLRHKGIVELLGHGEYKRQFPFVILEYIEGVTLTKLINIEPVEPARAVNILLQMVEAVEHAHSQDVFHRDLKPDNVMLKDMGKETESIKIIDFGIARIDNSFFLTGTATRYQVGTPHYISPNRLRHDPDDRADDIYALGLITYEMLTGINPLRKAADFTELQLLQEQIPPPRQINPNLPKAVEREIVRALSLNQINRHPSALEFGKSVKEAFSTPKEVKPVKPAPPPKKEKNPFETVKIAMPDEYLPGVDSDETKILKIISPGEQFLLEGDFEASIAFYDQAIQSDDRSDLYYARRAMGFLMVKDYEKATQDCQRALKLDEKNDFAHLIRGIIYRLKLWSAEAETELQKAISINPNNIEAALILGDIHASRGENEKALNYYAHISRVNRSFTWAYTNRGNLHYNLGEFEAAEEVLSLAIETHPQLDWNYYQRAKTRIKLGKNQEALADLTEALRFNPKSTTFFHERAKLLFNLGRTAEALADFNRIKELTDRDSFVPEEQSAGGKDKKTGLTSLVDYLKWILSK